MPDKLESPAAVIFDMDGVLVNSNPFHVEKWAEFLTKRHIPFDTATLPAQILGQRNDYIFRLFFGPEVSALEMNRLEEELEENFRQAFRPHAKPLEGLEALIRELSAARVPMAVASSATRENIDFILDALRFRSFFRTVMSGDEVHKPKPHPEIYLKTAEKLGVQPAACVAFEDSFVGVEAVKAADMKCVAIASTFSAQQLRARTSADRVESDFCSVSLPVLRSLFSRDGQHARYD